MTAPVRRVAVLGSTGSVGRTALRVLARQELRGGGERNLLEVEEFATNMKRLRELFDLFERKTSLLQILDISLRGRGVQIFIGGESGVTAPDDVAVVAAPYRVDGEVVCAGVVVVAGSFS